MCPLSPSPWTEANTDFRQLLNRKYMLIITDEYSHHVIVNIITSTSKKKIFAEFGILKSLKTNNGPTFKGQEFSTYTHHTGFKHRKITPLWPQANAKMECFMQTAKKSIKAAYAQGLNYQQELHKRGNRLVTRNSSSFKKSPRSTDAEIILTNHSDSDNDESINQTSSDRLRSQPENYLNPPMSSIGS